MFRLQKTEIAKLEKCHGYSHHKLLHDCQMAYTLFLHSLTPRWVEIAVNACTKLVTGYRSTMTSYATKLYTPGLLPRVTIEFRTDSHNNNYNNRRDTYYNTIILTAILGTSLANVMEDETMHGIIRGGGGLGSGWGVK